MKKLIIILSLAVLWQLAPAQDQLEPFRRMAAESNPGLKAAFSEYKAALEKAAQAGSLPDPQLSLETFISPIQTRTGPQRARIAITQAFPWFGTLAASENQSAKQAEAAYELFREKEASLYLQVENAWYDLYLNRKEQQLTLENLDLLRSLYRSMESRVETGKASSLDLYRIQMESGDLENKLALQKDMQTALEQSFRNLLNASDDFTIPVPDSLEQREFTMTVEEIKELVSTQNPRLKALQLQQEALQYRKELAENQGKPSFRLGFAYTIIGQGPDQLAGTDAFMFPMVGISLPIYRDKYRAMVNETVYLQEAKGYEKEEKENMLETLLAFAWKDYSDACRRLELFVVQEDLADLSLRIMLADYGASTGSFAELLRMERKKLGYGLELERARADREAAISFLNYLMGGTQ